MGQILNLRDKFVETSAQTDSKLTLLIETARKFRDGMAPLNEEVDQLHARVKSTKL